MALFTPFHSPADADRHTEIFDAALTELFGPTTYHPVDVTGTTSFGIDIGGSGMKAAPVDLATGKLTAERFKILTPSPSTPDNMADVVVQLVQHFDWHGPVGVTFPGVVRSGVVHTAANVDKSWLDVDADALFTKAVGGGVEVHVVNDADAAGLAEVPLRRRQGRARAWCSLLTFGTGIGSGLFLDGKLVPNTELGHLEIDGHDAEQQGRRLGPRPRGPVVEGLGQAGRAVPAGRRQPALARPDHRRRRGQPEGRQVGAADRRRHEDRPRRPRERGRHRRRRLPRRRREPRRAAPARPVRGWILRTVRCGGRPPDRQHRKVAAPIAGQRNDARRVASSSR